MENQQENMVEIKQDKKSKILLLVFILFILGSVAATYYRIFVKKDYIISAEMDCDPLEENCFVWECDPESNKEGEACTGNPEEDVWYYKIIHRKAFNIPLCDPNNEDCEALVCPEGEADCEEIQCTEETKGGEDICTNPLQYVSDHPEALEDEEEMECDEELDDCDVPQSETDLEEETEDGVSEASDETSETSNYGSTNLFSED